MEAGSEVRPAPADRHIGRHSLVAVLLGATFVALLWVPSYARMTPTLDGIPFFYWYSVLWLVVNAASQVIAYRIIRGHRPVTAGGGAAAR